MRHRPLSRSGWVSTLRQARNVPRPVLLKVLVPAPSRREIQNSSVRRSSNWDDRRFPNALIDAGTGEASMDLITLREIVMLQFMNAVTDKDQWRRKVFDKTIIDKWRDESIAPVGKMTLNMFSHCIQELQHRATVHDKQPGGAIEVFPGSVVKSDDAVPESVKLKLQQLVRPLEDVPEDEKDWHPYSNGKVLNLVHPSLFPLTYGVSRVVKRPTNLEDCISRCGEGDVMQDHGYTDYFDSQKYFYPAKRWNPYSSLFQWLPSDVEIRGDRPNIVSYINNLHPRHHRDLYKAIEDVIAAAIPLWNLTLGYDRDLYRHPRISYHDALYHPRPGEGVYGLYPREREGETMNDYYERCGIYEEKCMKERMYILPDAPYNFSPRSPTQFDLKNYKNGRLQIIVKLANIELTPEKPTYDGGSWHVEGMLNEAICAGALYYYSSSNITESSLAFRQQPRSPDSWEMSYEQDDHKWVDKVYGIPDHRFGSVVQELGAVKTREGRLITFPNILQHQVQPFKLEDDSKPGHRKLLALFLADPSVKIVSTANVPCQRRDWYVEERARGSPFAHFNNAGGLDAALPLTLEKAKELRLQLMNERSAFEIIHRGEFENGTELCLCEH